MTPGQQLALRQLLAVQAARTGGLEILSVREPHDADPRLCVEVSLDCAGVPHQTGGLRLRGRERFYLLIPRTFPLRPPGVHTPHRQWRGVPHVQWGYYVCLYAAPSVEWHPADAMFGLLERLWLWLQAAALGELDPDGVPLHPPVAYQTPGTPLIIPRADTPQVVDAPWLGWARSERVSEQRYDLTGWSPMRQNGVLQDVPSDGVAAVLLPSRLDWEYPRFAAGLIVALVERDVAWSDLWDLLEFTALEQVNERMVFVVGTAMRGIGGDEPRQHLAAWQLPTEATNDLWLSLVRHSKNEDRREIGQQARDRVMEWAKNAQTEWCAVREARPEVTVRRDEGSPIGWFAGRSVSIWGCGAIGSVVAEWLVRAGVGRLVLRDRGDVAPGLLVRQNYLDADLGYSKPDRLAQRLRAIDPTIHVEAIYGDVLEAPLGHGPWHDDVDVVVDVTASIAVATALERARAADPSRPVISMLFGHTAEYGIAAVCPSHRVGGPTHALRAAKLACSAERPLRGFADEFWPDLPRSDLFQPEPGCSDPTFSGSAVESAALAAPLLRAAAGAMQGRGKNTFVEMVALEGEAQRHMQRRLGQPDPWTLPVSPDLELRVSSRAMAAMRDEVETSARLRGVHPETGGLLFGERDDASGVLWVDEATGPPPDSRHSAEEFLCGTRGVKRMVATRKRRGRGSLQLVGTWHTHPVSPARPSLRDLGGMADILDAADSPLAQALLLIVGQSAGRRSSLGGYLFERAMLRDDLITVAGGHRRLARAVWEPIAGGDRTSESVTTRSKSSRSVRATRQTQT